MSDYFITLKWGTLKAYHIPQELVPFLQRYYADGEPMSAMMDRPDTERKKILCELIDAFDGPIDNDWTGEQYKTKEDAKKYVMEYGTNG